MAAFPTLCLSMTAASARVIGAGLEDDEVQARRRWASSFAVILLVHAGLWFMAVWWFDPVPVVTAPPPSAVMLDLAPLPAALPAPSTEIPPGPKQERVRPAKPAAPVEKPPLPRVREAPVALPENSPPAPPRPREEDRKPLPRTTAPPTAAAPPAAAAVAAASSAASMSLPSWQALLLARLQQFKRYPVGALARNQQGVAHLRFTMDRKGRVLTYRLEKSSRYTLLDEEALALLQRAQPLPEPPPSVAGDPLELVVPIEFFLKSRP